MANLQVLQQGDFSYDQRWFVYRSQPNDDGNDLFEVEIEGIVVLTQTCDIVRDPENRPYLEVCPLVKIQNKEVLEDIRKGRRPRYAHIAATVSNSLVADLDRIMTIDKLSASKLTFHRGCTTSEEQIRFANAIARKRSRFAFSNDFVDLLRNLQGRIIKKHSRQSPEGELLRRLEDIRILAQPSWGAATISLTFYFIVSTSDARTVELEEQCNTWMDLINSNSIFTSIDFIIATFAELSALEYLQSVPLDFEHLSIP